MEILFRGLTYKGEMISGTSIINRKDWVADVWVHRVFLLDGDACNHTPESSAFVEVKPNTVGRFTGLLDKNGAEIYEGDIVRWKFNHHVRDNAIYWSDDQAAFRGKLINSHGEFDSEEDRAQIINGLQNVTVTDSFTEVIGNIYENPELLEESA